MIASLTTRLWVPAPLGGRPDLALDLFQEHGAICRSIRLRIYIYIEIYIYII